MLYYNYNGEAAYAEKVIEGSQYYRSRSPYLDSITFVPAAGYTGTVRVSYRGMDTSGVSFTGRMTIAISSDGSSGEQGDIRYGGAAGSPVSFHTADFNAACRSAIGENLDYVRFTPPAAGQGMLYYNYRSGKNTGSAVDASTRYYRSGSRTIANLTFVPASDSVESVSIPFTGYGDSTGDRFEGTVVIDFTGNGGNIVYTTRAGRAAEFEAADFNELCQSVLGASLSHVRFTGLPSSSRGTLYYNHSSSSNGTRVDENVSIYRSGSPSLSRVAFVPSRSWSGSVNIGFTGYDSEGDSFNGTVQIQVEEGSGSQTIRYTVRAGGEVYFDAGDFDAASRDATGNSLSYVRFELPSSSRGELYYHRSGSSSSRVSENNSYYRSGSSRLLDDVSFQANGSYSGTVEIPYTGVSTGSGGRFSGTVSITVTASRAETIRYSGTSSPVYMSAADFRNACSGALSQGLSYVRFTSLPDSRAGQLYAGYTGASVGVRVSTGSSYYVNSLPNLGELCFVPQAGYQGTVSLSYTGYSASDEQVSGTVELTIVNNTPVLPAAASFNDMGNYSWAVPAVEALSRNGIVNGVGSGRFGPGQTIQRCDFTLMLCRAFNFNTGSTDGFPDVPADSYYAGAVATAKDLGVVTGSNGLFMPNSALSRQDAMLMLKRAMLAAGWSVPNGEGVSLSAFSDGGRISGYARGAVASMVQIGAVNGNEAGQLRPLEPITRAEMAVILYRVLNL